LCECGGREFVEIKLSGRGRLITFTKIYNVPPAYKKSGAYCVGLIELEEGVRIFAQLTDVEISELKIGMPVRAVFRKLYEEGESGVVHYGVKFTL